MAKLSGRSLQNEVPKPKANFPKESALEKVVETEPPLPGQDSIRMARRSIRSKQPRLHKRRRAGENRVPSAALEGEEQKLGGTSRMIYR